MQYALLLYEDEQVFGGPEKNGPALKEVAAKHWAFVKELGATRVGGAGLKGSAFTTTIRTRNRQQTIHDGPFAEAKEQLGGFYIVDVPDLDAAVAIAKRIPLAADGVVEIRPLLSPPPG